jgi:hypothetical protein
MEPFMFQKFLFSFLSSSIKLLAHIEMPWRHDILSGDQIREILTKALPGDVLLVKCGGSFLPMLLGGFSHVAFCVEVEKIMDSTTPGVAYRDMINVLVGYTRAAILRPKFTTEEIKGAIAQAWKVRDSDSQKNIEYNFHLVENGTESSDLKAIPSALTCSQFCRYILNAGRENFLDLRKRFGYNTITPGDFFAAQTKFDVIVDIHN